MSQVMQAFLPERGGWQPQLPYIILPLSVLVRSRKWLMNFTHSRNLLSVCQILSFPEMRSRVHSDRLLMKKYGVVGAKRLDESWRPSASSIDEGSTVIRYDDSFAIRADGSVQDIIRVARKSEGLTRSKIQSEQVRNMKLADRLLMRRFLDGRDGLSALGDGSDGLTAQIGIARLTLSTQQQLLIPKTHIHRQTQKLRTSHHNPYVARHVPTPPSTLRHFHGVQLEPQQEFGMTRRDDQSPWRGKAVVNILMTCWCLPRASRLTQKLQRIVEQA